MVGRITLLNANPKALIIFARYPRAGEVKTRLGSAIGMEQAAVVYRQLAEHSFAVAKQLAQTGVRLCLFYEPSATESEMKHWVGDGFELFPQEGGDLGERMRGAFRKVFDEGAPAASIIGTDIPGLDADLLDEGFRHLDDVPVVIGPAVDGGYYLLGMRQGVGDLFSGLQWSSPQVLPQTLGKLREMNLEYRMLRELTDIDTLDDWERFMRSPQRCGDSKKLE